MNQKIIKNGTNVVVVTKYKDIMLLTVGFVRNQSEVFVR